jgi:hypothetical protein
VSRRAALVAWSAAVGLVLASVAGCLNPRPDDFPSADVLGPSAGAGGAAAGGVDSDGSGPTDPPGQTVDDLVDAEPRPGADDAGGDAGLVDAGAPDADALAADADARAD